MTLRDELELIADRLTRAVERTRTPNYPEDARSTAQLDAQQAAIWEALRAIADRFDALAN